MNYRNVFLGIALLCLPVSVFGDTLTVVEAIRMAYAAHPIVKSAKSEINAAKGERLVELSPPPPTLSMEYEGIPQNGGLSDYSERKMAIEQELEFPLKYLWRASVLNSDLNAAYNTALIRLLDLESEVRNAYCTLWSTVAKTELLQQNTEAAELYATQLERQVELGEAVPLEARRARVEALQTRADFNTIQHEQAAARMKLAQVINFDTSTVIVMTPLESIRLPDELIPENLTANPEINAAGFDLDRATAEQKLAQSGWLPDIGISYFRQKVPAEPSHNYWGIEAGLSVPIWFWLGGRGEIQKSAALKRRAESELAIIQLESGAENVKLVQSINALQERFHLYESKVVPLAKETYELSLKAFNLGEANYLQVIDAQRSSLAIQIEFIELSAELYETFIKLDRLAGRSILGGEDIKNLLIKGN